METTSKRYLMMIVRVMMFQMLVTMTKMRMALMEKSTSQKILLEMDRIQVVRLS
jgi:predicted lipid carrier protein YhbT